MDNNTIYTGSQCLKLYVYFSPQSNLDFVSVMFSWLKFRRYIYSDLFYRLFNKFLFQMWNPFFSSRWICFDYSYHYFYDRRARFLSSFWWVMKFVGNILCLVIVFFLLMLSLYFCLFWNDLDNLGFWMSVQYIFPLLVSIQGSKS